MWAHHASPSVQMLALNEVFSPDFPDSLPSLPEFPVVCSSPPSWPSAVPPRGPSGGSALYLRAGVQWLPRADIIGGCAHAVFIQTVLPVPNASPCPAIVGVVYRHNDDHADMTALLAAMTRAVGARELARSTDAKDAPLVAASALASTRALSATITAAAAAAIAHSSHDAAALSLTLNAARDAAVAAATEAKRRDGTPLPLLLVGDFNARSPEFGDAIGRATAAGRQLSAFCDAHDLTVLNNSYAGGIATRPVSNAVLDLALTNAPHLFAGLTVGHDNDLLVSDHRPLRVVCAARFPSMRLATPSDLIRWAVDRADWDAFELAAAAHGRDALARCVAVAADIARTRAAPRLDFYDGAGAGAASATAAVDAACAAEERASWNALSLSNRAYDEWRAAHRRYLLSRTDANRRHNDVTEARYHAAEDAHSRALHVAGVARAAARSQLPAVLPSVPPPAAGASRAIEEMWAGVRDALHAAARGAVPVNSQHKRSPHFLHSLSLRDLLRDVRRCHRHAAAVPCEATRTALATARRAFSVELKAAGERYFDALCERVGDQTANWKGVLRPRSSDGALFTVASARAAAAPLPAAADGGGECISAEARSLDLVAEAFAANSTLPPDPRDAALLGECGGALGDACPRVGTASVCNADITLEEVAGVLKSLRRSGAAGCDSIPNAFLRHSPPPMVRAVHALLAASFDWGVLPRDWRSSTVVPSHKGHGAPPDAIDSYRPIALTSCVCKALERVLLARLRAVIGPRMHGAQFGFRARRGTADALHFVRSSISAQLAGAGAAPQSHVTAAFLDISKAFDSTWHAAVLAKLHRLGVHGRLWRWVAAFLADRRLRVTYSGRVSRWVAVNAGVPQGSAISPDLFLAFINDLPALDRSHRVAFALFADDIGLWPRPPPQPPPARSDHAAIAARTVQQDVVLHHALNAIDGWARDWRVTFGIAKCGTMRMHRAGTRRMRHLAGGGVYAAIDADPHPINDFPARAVGGGYALGRVAFRLNGQRLPECSTYRYLGVLWSADLTWHRHAEAITVRVRAAASRVIRVIRRHAPPRLACVRQLVAATVVPIITHGACVWSPVAGGALCKAKLAARLTSALVQPLRIALGLPWHASFATILAECGMPDLLALFDRHAVAFVARAAELPASHPTRQLVADQLTGRCSTDRAWLPSLQAACTRLFGGFSSRAPCAVDDFAVVPLAATGGGAAHRLANAALQSSFRRWQRCGECRDHAARRRAPSRPSPADLRAISRGVRARAFPRRGVAGVAAYLRVFSKPAAVLAARLRLNRAAIGDSMKRRAMVDSDECVRCPTRAADTPFHFLAECAGNVSALAPLAALRAQPRFRELFLLPPGTRDATPLLGDAPPGMTHAAASDYLALLSRFYDSVLAAGFAV